MSSHAGSRPASVSAVSSTTTVTSEMSMAYRNRKVMKHLNAWYYGSGRFPFKIAIVCFIIGFLIFFAGVVLLALIGAQRQLDIGNWWGNIIGAGLIVAGILVFALGVKFLFDARKKSTQDRKKLAFRPKGLTKVSVVNNAFESDKESNYKTKSGTSSIKAVNSPYASTVGTRSHVSHSVHSGHSGARTGDSLPSLDNRPISYSSNPRPDRDRPQGRYQQNPNRPSNDRYHDNRGYNREDSRGSGYNDRYDDRGRGHDDRRGSDRGYDDRRGPDRGYDDRSRGSDRGYDDRSRGSDRGYDDRSRGSDRGYDDRSRGSDRGYDDRRGYNDRRDPPSRSASRDFTDIPLDGDTYI